ncbi:MAG: DUF222 domain-containing protein, partial [Actinomycetota bacterium]|nr:DUF222 domain-containing protein [Actinomycetota bacterium]
AEASDDELVDAMEQLHGLMSAAHARLLSFVAAYEERGAFLSDGAPSMADWLAARLHLSRSSARAWAACASGLSHLPALAGAFGEGMLSFEQVEPLARVAGPVEDEHLSLLAPAWSVAQCRLYARRARPVGTEEANKAYERRFLTMHKNRDGELRISGLLDPEGGSVVEQALCDKAEQASPDPATGQFEPYAKRVADALVDLVAAGHHATEPGRATVVVHVDGDVLAAPVDSLAGEAEGGSVEAEGGQGLSAETARRLSCDCIWQLVVEAYGTDAAEVAKARRSAPGWLRRQLRRRDATCRFPGCERTRLLHAHHIRHWASGGPTEASNLVFLCSRHHRFVHEEGWVISGDPASELSFTSPGGRSFPSRPVPLRPDLATRIFGPDPPSPDQPRPDPPRPDPPPQGSA